MQRLYIAALACLISVSVFSQTLYNPQIKYENIGGFYDIDSIRELNIQFYESNFNSILDSTYYNNPDFRLPAQIFMGNSYLDSVAIRYKGYSSYINCSSSIKKPYNIDINSIINDYQFMGYKKIKLSNCWFDPTFLKELLACKLYQRYLPTYEANLIRIQTQGEYTGLYLNQEAINKQFLEKHFGENDGAFFKCDPINNDLYSSNLQFFGSDSTMYFNSYEIKSTNGWSELINLIEILNNNPENIGSVLNVDRVIWYFALNQVLMNYDSYNIGACHNYYLYQTADGLFQIIPWDLSESFINTANSTPTGILSDPFYNEPNKPLLNIILNNDIYRKIYTAHLRTILQESLNISWFYSSINELQSLAIESVTNDTEKGFSTQDFFDNINQQSFLYDYITIQPLIPVILERIEDFENYLDINYSAPLITNMSISNNSITVNVNNANTVQLMISENEFGSNFSPISMFDNGTNGDLISGDGIYTLLYPFQFSNSNLKFYILAENNDAVSLSPERAEYEYYMLPSQLETIHSEVTSHRKLVNKIDLLGREVNHTTNQILFYIYDDGSVEKKFIVE